jgi:CRISPR-associated RAMP protein (TIGR02581 family)
MHKQRLNEWILDLVIEPDGPLLIKSGTESGADPTLPDMNFVRTHPHGGERTVYLPGSSLKGALRSHAEQVIRTVFGRDPTICCDPLDRREACDRRVNDITDTAEQYRQLCMACRVFGHTVQASHFTVTDAYPVEPVDVLPVRHQVAIDRMSGGVAVGPFELEVAESGRFETRLTLVNFEIWQLGLLALVLRDLAEGRLPLGYGKSRGLGRVTATFKRLEIAYPGRFADRIEGQSVGDSLFGVGALVAPSVCEAYGYQPGDRLDLPDGGRIDPEGAAWGRPALGYGVARDESLDLLSEDDLVDAHTAIRPVLGATVAAWAARVPNV